MKKTIFYVLCLLMLLLSACGGKQRDLVDMQSCTVKTDVTEVRAVVWGDKTYVPFCVSSASDRGEQIGYVDGNKDDRISEYKGYSTDEWLINWISTDGGAGILMKEQSVTDIPEGLESEYQ